jgi:hypothetical protein
MGFAAIPTEAPIVGHPSQRLAPDRQKCFASSLLKKLAVCLNIVLATFFQVRRHPAHGSS